MTEFIKRAIGNIDGLVRYINQKGADIQTSDVRCCGAVWCRDAVMWRGAWYLVYTDNTKTIVRNIDVLADKINAEYSELDWGRSCG